MNSLLFVLVVSILQKVHGVHPGCSVVPNSVKQFKGFCGGLMIPTSDAASEALIKSVSTGKLACARTCFKTTRGTPCKSFTWDSESRTCNLYSKSGNNLNLQQARHNHTRFFNRACFHYPSCFHIKFSSPDTKFDGRYVYVYWGDYFNLNPAEVTKYPEAKVGSVFALYPDGIVIDVKRGLLSRQIITTSGSPLPDFTFPDLSMVDHDPSHFNPIKCTINETSLELSCTSASGSFFYFCTDHFRPQYDDYQTGVVLTGGENPEGNGYESQARCWPIRLFAELLS